MPAVANTIRGTLRECVHMKHDKSWSIVIMDDDSKCTGPPPIDGWQKGAEYILAGKWVETENFGRQYQFKSVSLAIPVTPEGLKSYLRKVAPGVGAAIAERIWTAYGENCCEILRTDPAKVAEEISGISDTKARDIAKVLENAKNTEYVNIQLASLLDGYGFRNSVYSDVYRLWGIEAANKIRRNPFYLLTHNIPSVGFRRVDKLYCDLYANNKKKLDRILRQGLCGWWTMRRDNSGNSWLHHRDLQRGILEQMQPREYNFDRIMKFMKRAGFVFTREHKGTLYVTDNAKYWCEQNVARRIAAKMAEQIPPIPKPDEDSDLSPHQLEQVYVCANTNIGILCGTPGTGKTFTSACIIKSLLNAGYDVGMAAPTGKAAVRITAALTAMGVRDIKASTIHTMLEPHFNDQGHMSFKHNEDNPLPYDVVIIDEASMLDMPLFNSLLSAIPRGCRLLLVGDQYQLPPVGWGQPLTDLIRHGTEFGIGIGELTEIYRNAGGIVKACQDIKNGTMPAFAKKFIPGDKDSNFLLMPSENKDLIIQRLMRLMDVMISRGDSLTDIQIITATNGLRCEVNTLIQERYNPQGWPIEGNRFRQGDKAIILKNKKMRGCTGHVDWNTVNTLPKNSLVYAANGDVGKVIQALPNATYIQLVNPERTVIAGSLKIEEEDANKRKDRLAEPVNSDSVAQVDLAYAITGHKSQGSGYKYVIILVEPGFGAMQVMSRQWLYTATSRGEEFTIFIGDEKVIAQVLKRICNTRLTFLPDAIHDNVARLKDANNGTDAQDNLEVPVYDSD